MNTDPSERRPQPWADEIFGPRAAVALLAVSARIVVIPIRIALFTVSLTAAAYLIAAAGAVALDLASYCDWTELRDATELRGPAALRPSGCQASHDVIHAPFAVARDGLGSSITAAVFDSDPFSRVLGGVDVTPASVSVLWLSASVCGRALRPRKKHRPAALPAPISATAPAASLIDDHGAVRELHARRVIGVVAALEQLDAEWLSYSIDLEAYFLTKPVLRDPHVEATADYQTALYTLREIVDGGLSASSTDAAITEAEHAADMALAAWAAANDHAVAVGVSDRSPTERAALRRLHKLTGQLTNPATPQPMWPTLIDAITRELARLHTCPATWDHLSNVPALTGRTPAALTASEEPRPEAS